MKKLLAILLSLVMCFTLIACTQTEAPAEETAQTTDTAQEGEPADSATTTLEIYCWDDDVAIVEPIAEAYTAMTGVAINISSYPNADYHDKMSLLINANEDVDIMDVGFIANITPYVERGMLEPLNSYIDNSSLDMSGFGEGYSAYELDGEYYTLPTRRVVWMLFTNTNILSDMGVTIPENMTWDEYRDIALQLTTGEGDEKQFGGQWMPWTKHMQLVQAGKNILDDDLTELQTSYEFLNDVMNVDNSFMDVAEMSAGANDYISWFVNGQTATMIQGEWSIQLINSMIEEEGITDFAYDCYPMPISEGIEPLTTGGNYSTWGIPVTSDDKEEAFKFLEYMCGSEAAEIIAQVNKIPGYSDSNIEQIFVENSNVPSAADIFTYKVYDLMPGHEAAGEINTMMNEESELYLVGSQSIEQTMENIYDRREEILAD